MSGETKARLSATYLTTLPRERGIVCWRILAVAILLFSLYFLGYVSLSPSLFHQHWDSLAYAHFAEIDGTKAIWGNHPLGHVILNLSLLLARHLGYGGRALTYFEFINSLVSAYLIALLFYHSIVLFRNTFLGSLGLALLLGGSYSFWRYAGTADIYSFATLFSFLSWMALFDDLYRANRPMMIRSGFLTGLAVLSHQLNALLIFVGLFLIMNAEHEKARRVISFLVLSSLCTLIGYALLGSIAAAASPAAILSWMKGYFVDPTYGHYLDVNGLAISLQTVPKAIMSPSWSRLSSFARIGVLFTLATGFLWGITRSMRSRNPRAAIFAAAVLDLAASGILITWWEPSNVKFWLLTLVPFVVSLVAISTSLEQAISIGVSKFAPSVVPATGFFLPLVAIAVLCFNLKAWIIPNHQEDVIRTTALGAWIAHSNSAAMLIPTDDITPYLLYWEDRPGTTELYHTLLTDKNNEDRFKSLAFVMNNELCGEHMVLFEPLVIDQLSESKLSILNLTREEINSFFARYNRKLAFSLPIDFDKQAPVFLILGPKDCSN